MVFLLSILAGKSFLTVYATEDKEVTRIVRSFVTYWGKNCNETEGIISKTYDYSVLEQDRASYYLYVNDVWVDVTGRYYTSFHCSQISESQSVLDWQCYKEGKDIFAADRDYVHSRVTVTLSFGSDFAQLDSSKYKLSNGGEGTKYCKGTREAKFAYTGIIIVAAVILILLILCALYHKKKNNFSYVCYPNHTHSNPIPSTICKVT